MFNYPNGKKFNSINKSTKSNNSSSNKNTFSCANRGMSLEEDINISNEYYLSNNIALITKRPTPINVVKVDYTHGARIIDAYFEKQSTTDYNGIYRSKYVDFEAKNTKSTTSFPMANISLHQINHLRNVISFNGLAFFIIRFEKFDETYLLGADYIIDFYINGERKSIPYKDIKEKGILIKNGYMPRLDYIKALDSLYF